MSKDNIKPAMVIDISDADETPAERIKYNTNVVEGLLRNREQPIDERPKVEQMVPSQREDISESNVNTNISEKIDELKSVCFRMPASLNLEVSHIALDSGDIKLTPILNELCYLFAEDEDLRNKILMRIKDKKEEKKKKKKKITN